MLLETISPFTGRLLDMVERPGGVIPMDVYRKYGSYTLLFDLPGVDAGQVEVTYESGVLTVSAERPAENDAGVNWLLRERPSGRHRRRVTLGDELDGGRAEAVYENGVLRVTIPVRETAQPKRVQIATGVRKGIGAGAAA